MSDHIKFNYNHNNKLICPSFTTIRLRDDNRYQVGKTFDIYLQLRNGTENYLGQAIIRDISHFKLNQLSIMMSHIDMGVHPAEGRKWLMETYEAQRPDWSTQELSFILLENQETGIRNVIPDRIRLKQPELNLFTTVPYGYELAK